MNDVVEKTRPLTKIEEVFQQNRYNNSSLACTQELLSENISRLEFLANKINPDNFYKNMPTKELERGKDCGDAEDREHLTGMLNDMRMSLDESKERIALINVSTMNQLSLVIDFLEKHI